MKWRNWIFGWLIAMPGLAFAHGDSNHVHGFLQGFAHPLTGLDHLLAIVAVGILAVSCDRRINWAIPAVFVSLMLAGALLGRMSLHIYFVEQGVLASVLVLGLLIAVGGQLPHALRVVIVGLFAIFHGLAHGAEMSQTADESLYLGGMVLSTGLLHSLGILAGRVLADNKATYHAGIVIALGSLVLTNYA